MKRTLVLPAAAALGGAAAFALRLMQNHTGFDIYTGLAVPGNVYARALVLLLAVLAVLMVSLSFLIPRNPQMIPELPADFTTTEAIMLVPGVSGSFLLILSGVFEALSALQHPVRFQLLTLLLGVLTVVAAYGAVAMTLSCKPYSRRDRGISGEILLLLPVVMVVRLVVTYRIVSNDPVIAGYYPQLLAQLFLVLAFYRLTSFSFLAGSDRRFAVYTACAVVLCLCTLADTLTLPQQLLYLGSAITLTNFLLLRLLHTPKTQEEAPY